MREKQKILVRSVPERFRRAGMEFTREPREVEVDAKVLRLLKEEPMLVVDEKGKGGK